MVEQVGSSSRLPATQSLGGLAPARRSMPRTDSDVEGDRNVAAAALGWRAVEQRPPGSPQFR